MDKSKKRIQNYWNWRSASYELDREKSLETEQDWESVINDLVSRIKTPDNGQVPRALDVGTGPGQLAFYLARAGFEVTGIDLSAGMIDQARQKAKHMDLDIDFRTGDAESLPFEDNSFDVVVSRNLVWTLPCPETALAEWHRVLKPGGRIVVSDGFWKNQTWPGFSKMAIDAVKAVLKRSGLVSLRFILYYAGLIKNLPLYEGVTHKNMGELMQHAGFKNVAACNIKDCFRIHPYGMGKPLSPPFFILYSDKPAGHFSI